MSKVVIREQQARDIASRVPESSCASVRIQDDGLLHGDIEVDIDRAGLRRGKTETLVCILYEAPEAASEEKPGSAPEADATVEETVGCSEAEAVSEAEERLDDAAEAEDASDEEAPDGDAEAEADAEEDAPADGNDAAQDDDEDEALGSPILANAEKGHVAIVTTKVAVPDDELIKTVKVPLTKVFPDLGGKSVRVAAIPYRSKKPILAVVATLAILAIIVGIVISNWGDPRARKGYYEGKTKEEIQADLDSQVDWYAMEISVANAMIVTEGQTEVEARIENVVNNHCDQKVKIYPDGHPEDILFESGAIRPGEYIQTIELSHPLPVGRHNITVEFQGYDQSPTLISNEGQFLGHDTFGASCAAQVTLEVRPKEAEYGDEG